MGQYIQNLNLRRAYENREQMREIIVEKLTEIVAETPNVELKDAKNELSLFGHPVLPRLTI